ncbi:MAG: hypothetical protein DRP15_03525, partial [Candidatus Aenigmatarchaeota archaeon]
MPKKPFDDLEKLVKKRKVEIGIRGDTFYRIHTPSEKFSKRQQEEERRFYRNFWMVVSSSAFLFLLGFYVYNHTGERIKIFIDKS